MSTACSQWYGACLPGALVAGRGVVVIEVYMWGSSSVDGGSQVANAAIVSVVYPPSYKEGVCLCVVFKEDSLLMAKKNKIETAGPEFGNKNYCLQLVTDQDLAAIHPWMQEATQTSVCYYKLSATTADSHSVLHCAQAVSSSKHLSSGMLATKTCFGDATVRGTGRTVAPQTSQTTTGCPFEHYESPALTCSGPNQEQSDNMMQDVSFDNFQVTASCQQNCSTAWLGKSGYYSDVTAVPRVGRKQTSVRPVKVDGLTTSVLGDGALRQLWMVANKRTRTLTRWIDISRWQMQETRQMNSLQSFRPHR